MLVIIHSAQPNTRTRPVAALGWALLALLVSASTVASAPADEGHLLFDPGDRDVAGRAMDAFDQLRLLAAHWLGYGADRWGFLTMLVGLAGLSRVIVLPFAIKAERDQVLLRRLAPEIDRLTELTKDDPGRAARTMRQLGRRHGLTPLRNLVALLGWPVLMLCAIAVGDAAAIGGYAIEPFGRLSRSDPTYLTAVLGAALLVGYLDWAHRPPWRQRWALWLGLMPLVTVALARLPVAVNLFVSVFAALLLLQHAVVDGELSRAASHAWRRLQRRRGRDGIVPLRYASGLTDLGREAERLGMMIMDGLPILRGVVLTPQFVARWEAATAEGKARLARRVMRKAGPGPYLMRGSGGTGRGHGDSGSARRIGHAVTGLDDVTAAIDQMVAGRESGSMSAIVLQREWVAEHRGVLDTRAPDAPGLMLVEVSGDPDGFVTGRMTSGGFRFGRHTGQRVDGTEAPFDLAPLLAFGRALEDRFGAPQRIEWISDGRMFQIVRSCDIGTEVTGRATPVLTEWARVLDGVRGPARGNDDTLVRNVMCDGLPRPTPATRSLIEALHASGGGVDRACRALGLDYDVAEDAAALFPVVFGRLYCNASELRRRVPRLTRLDRRRISRRALEMEKRVRNDVLPRWRTRSTATGMPSFDLLTTGRLAHEISAMAQRFINDSSVELEMMRIVSGVVQCEAREALRSGGHDWSRWLAAKDDVPSDPADALSAVLEHRRLADYSLASPRTMESQDWRRIGSSAQASNPGPMPGATGNDMVLDDRTAGLVRLARLVDRLSEEVNRAVLSELHLLREALLALDRRFDLRNGIFLLSLEEIVALSNSDRQRVQALVATRKMARETVLAAAPLPETISIASLELASWDARAGASALDECTDRRVSGVRVAGDRRAGGRACVVDEAAAASGEPLGQLMPGDVLVAPFVHPAWFSDLLRASGIVLSRGGWLCDLAVVARQRNIAMIVDVAGWADIADGAHVTLEIDGSIRVAEVPATPETDVCLAVEA